MLLNLAINFKNLILSLQFNGVIPSQHNQVRPQGFQNNSYNQNNQMSYNEPNRMFYQLNQ
jgi:hypothetical protein